MAEQSPIEFEVWLVPKNSSLNVEAPLGAELIGFVTVHPELIPPGQTAVEWAQELMATRTPDIL